jgi:hypothetical protein
MSKTGATELEVPHPRDVFDLQGHEAAEAAFEEARGRGRLHHAWLLTGPEGVGKATFAYRAARRLLGAPAEPRHGLLGTDPAHPVARQVMGRRGRQAAQVDPGGRGSAALGILLEVAGLGAAPGGDRRRR